MWFEHSHVYFLLSHVIFRMCVCVSVDEFATVLYDLTLIVIVKYHCCLESHFIYVYMYYIHTT